MTQEQAIIKYLKTHKNGSGLDFIKKLGILCYTKVLTRIRRDFAPANGYVVHRELKEVKSRYGKTRIAFYSLVKVDNKKTKSK